MIPEKDERFNAYTSNGIVGTKGYRHKVRGGPFTCARVDNNGVHTADRVFVLKVFIFKAVPARDAIKK